MTNTTVPRAFKFRPTDEDLLSYFLTDKVNETPIPDIYPVSERHLFGENSTPWYVLKEDDPWDDSELPNKKIIYVFARQIFMSDKTRNRVVRTAGCGTWGGKAVTQDIKNSRGKVIGHKKSFTFKPHKGHESEMNGRGRWIMHEYSLPAKVNRNNSDFVICRISKELPKEDLLAREESQSTTVDQSPRTDSTMSSTTNTGLHENEEVITYSSQRKSSSVNYNHDHRRQKKASNNIEEQTNQDREHLIPYLHENEEVIPYSSQPLPYSVEHPFTTQQKFYAPLPWDHANLETTNHDIGKYQIRRKNKAD